MANDNQSINLLPGAKEGTFLTVFLNWALTIGRLLIILVETLALGTFLYRFNLDMKIVDLADLIKAESTIVKNSAPQEEKFRNLQARLALAKTYNESNKTPTVFKAIAEMGRGKVTFRNLLVATDQVKIEVEAPNATKLEEFTTALRNYQEITDLSVDKVENKTTSATVIVIMSARLQQSPNSINPNETDTSMLTPVPEGQPGGGETAQ